MNNIRPAATKDIPQIMNLLTQVLKVHNAGRPDLFKPSGMKYTEDEIANILADDNLPVFVCTDDNDNVICHAFCQIIDRPDRTCAYPYKTLFIDDFVVDEKFRGKGIGKQMYSFLKNYAGENGFYNITLHAWECNPGAVSFYNNIGMKVQSYTMEEIL